MIPGETRIQIQSLLDDINGFVVPAGQVEYDAKIVRREWGKRIQFGTALGFANGFVHSSERGQETGIHPVRRGIAGIQFQRPPQ